MKDVNGLQSMVVSNTHGMSFLCECILEIVHDTNPKIVLPDHASIISEVIYRNQTIFPMSPSPLTFCIYGEYVENPYIRCLTVVIRSLLRGGASNHLKSLLDLYDRMISPIGSSSSRVVFENDALSSPSSDGIRIMSITPDVLPGNISVACLSYLGRTDVGIKSLIDNNNIAVLKYLNYRTSHESVERDIVGCICISPKMTEYLDIPYTPSMLVGAAKAGDRDLFEKIFMDLERRKIDISRELKKCTSLAILYGYGDVSVRYSESGYYEQRPSIFAICITRVTVTQDLMPNDVQYPVLALGTRMDNTRHRLSVEVQRIVLGTRMDNTRHRPLDTMHISVIGYPCITLSIHSISNILYPCILPITLTSTRWYSEV
jgi:hypothetical protein